VKRVLAIARIQLTNWPYTVVYPLGLTAALIVFGLGIDATNGGIGSSHPIFLLPSIYLMIAGLHLQAMTQLFPFAAALGATRRAFALATAMMIAAYAAVFGLLCQLLAAIERATNGWGRHIQIFALDFLHQNNPVAQWLVYTVPVLMTSSVGVLIGVIFQRWRQLGISVLSVGTAVVLAISVYLGETKDWWSHIGHFFSTQPTLALLAGYPLAIAVLLGATSWTVLRRATP
jgi:hypothetical protein